MVVEGRTRFWLIMAAVVVVGVWAVGAILMPFLAGGLLGFLLDPVCDWLERRGLSRAGAAGLVIGGALLGGGALLVVLVPFLWSQVVDLVVSLPALKVRALAALHPY